MRFHSSKVVESGSSKIFIAGCPILARQICQEYVTIGACVNIVETDYVYKFGAEKGVTVEFINYPRFPKTPLEIFESAFNLGNLLLKNLHQGSFTIVNSGWNDPIHNFTQFFSLRGDIECEKDN